MDLSIQLTILEAALVLPHKLRTTSMDGTAGLRMTIDKQASEWLIRFLSQKLSSQQDTQYSHVTNRWG